MKKIVSTFLMLILVLECGLFYLPGKGVYAEEPEVTWLNLGRKPGTYVVCSEVNAWAQSDPAFSMFLPSSLNDGDTNTYSGYYTTETKTVAESTVTISYVFDGFYSIDNVILWPCYKDQIAVGFPEDFTISVKSRYGGWRTVETQRGYVVEATGGQQFLFDAVVGNEIQVSVSKMTSIGVDAEGKDQYGVYMTEMEVYGYPITIQGETENIARSMIGTIASSNYATAEEIMVENGYTTDALIDGDDSEWAPSFSTSANSKPDDDVIIQLDFPGWYTMDDISLKPRIEINEGVRKAVGFPENFDVSVHTENGWENVLEVQDYTVEILDKQSFDFPEITGNALQLHVTRVPQIPNLDLTMYIMFLTEMYVYGREAQIPGFNILQSGNVEISASSTSSWAQDNGYTVDKLIDNRTDFGALGYFSDEYYTPDTIITIDLDLKGFYKIREVILYPYWTDWNKEVLNNFPIDFIIEAKTIDGWTIVKEVTDYINANNDANQFALDKEYECEKIHLTITKLPESPVNAGKYVLGLSELQVIGGNSDISYISAEENLEIVSQDVHCVAGAAKGSETDATAINDGDTDTLYTGNPYTTGDVESGEYALITLDRPARISKITIDTNKKVDQVFGFPIDFRLRVYSDGAWKDVVEKKNFKTILDKLEFTFEAVEAERIELFATKLSETETVGTYALQVKELSIYGKPTSTNVTGDLNLDYTLDAKDLKHMRNVLLQKEYLMLKGADVNSDMNTDIRDLVALYLRVEANKQVKSQEIGTIYYVNSGVIEEGNGLSPETPIRTLDQVNQLKLQAGDQVLLKRGTEYRGCLEISASGEEDNPIVVGAYGEGNNPIIHGEGLVNAAIYGENVSYITVRDVEVTNKGDVEGQHRGIYFVAKSRSIYGITIENCYVHDVDSLVDNLEVTIPGLGDRHWTGGIVVRSRSEEFCAAVANLRKISVNNVVIQHNTVENCLQVGVIVGGSSIDNGYPSLGVCVRGNNISKCGDGIMVFGCHAAILEGNVAYNNAANVSSSDFCAGIWCAESSGSLFQYNECSSMNKNDDGEGFDVDNVCSGTLLQYNYSHDNYGGAVLLMQGNSGSVTMRYNVSQNDGHNIGFWGVVAGENNHIVNIGVSKDAAPYLSINAHHNIIYTNKNYIEIIGFSSDYTKFKTSNVGTIKNNIFYATGKTPYLSDSNSKKYLYFDENVYYGVSIESSDVNGLSSYPQFTNPGGAGEGILSLDAYMLASTSPYKAIGFKAIG